MSKIYAKVTKCLAPAPEVSSTDSVEEALGSEIIGPLLLLINQFTDNILFSIHHNQLIESNLTAGDNQAATRKVPKKVTNKVSKK